MTPKANIGWKMNWTSQFVPIKCDGRVKSILVENREHINGHVLKKKDEQEKIPKGPSQTF